MSKLGPLVFACLGIVVVMLAGCAVGPTRVEADFGRSVDLARSNQILDPAAQQNLAPVYGFDGKAAAATLERYRSTFEKEAPPPTFVLPVGSAR